MTSSFSPPVLSIFEVYSRYCEIEAQDGHWNSREKLTVFSRSLGTRHTLFNDLYKLIAILDFSSDSHKFSHFYDFVFFICRENGQKNITVNKALCAWRLVLRGRFRLLNQWCEFLEKYQRHNISQDTWRQVLAFSRCVYEDLEGYDPKGAWPVLIDDFVDYMYRSGASTCSSWDFPCDCREEGDQSNISNTLRGLKLLSGSKRRSLQRVEGKEVEARFLCSEYNTVDAILRFKRSRQTMDLDMDTQNNHSTVHAFDSKNDRYNPIGGGSITTACAAENSLLKASKGHLGVA